MSGRSKEAGKICLRRQIPQARHGGVGEAFGIEQTGLRSAPHRIIEPDVAGNYLEYRFGPSAEVFIDDRYDMYPTSIAEDYQTMYFIRKGALAVLDRYRADVVLWQDGQPLVTLLQASGQWREAFHGGGWVVLRRR